MTYLGDWLRIIFSFVLLFGVYLETGWVTTVCIFLLIARAEVQDYNAKLTFKSKP